MIRLVGALLADINDEMIAAERRYMLDDPKHLLVTTQPIPVPASGATTLR